MLNLVNVQNFLKARKSKINFNLNKELQDLTFEDIRSIIERFELTLEIFDFHTSYKYKKGKLIKFEDRKGYWVKYKYNQLGQKVRKQTSNNCDQKWEYDSFGHVIKIEKIKKYWEKHEYDENGNKIFQEYSDGCWKKISYNDKGHMIKVESSNNYWEIYE